MRFSTNSNRYFTFFIMLLVLGITNLVNAQTIDDLLKNIDNQKYSTAEKMAKDLIQKEPNNPAAYYYLGKLYLMTSKIDQAAPLFDKGAQVNQDDQLNNVGKGAILLSKNDNENAEKTFIDALKESEYNVNIAANIADAYIILNKKNTDVPKKYLTQTKDKADKSKDKKDNKRTSVIYLKLGELMYSVNDYNNAISNFQNSIDYDKSSVKGYVGIASIYSKIKQYDLAENNLKEALNVDSTYATTYEVLADLYYATRRYDDAVANYKKFLSLTEPNNDKQLRYASMLFLAKKYSEAIDALKSIEANNSNNPQLYHILAYSYFSLDNQADGITAYDKYFSLEKPSEISASDYTTYADMLSKTGKDSLAVIALQKALAIDSTDSEVHLTLANVLYKSKKYAEAADEFTKANTFAKKQLGLRDYFNWGQSYLSSKQYPLADSVFKKVTEIKSDLPLGYLYRAYANASQDTSSELGLAKPFYEKFIELTASTPDKYKNMLIQAYSYLGYYYFLKKDVPEFKDTWRENYKTNWEKVLSLDPNNEQAKAAIDNLKILK